MNLPVIHSVVGFLGHFFLLCALMLWISRSAESRSLQRAVPFAVFLLLLVPVSGLPVVGYIRGMIGDLSITSTLLLGIWILSQISGVRRGLGSHRAVLAGAAAGGLALYPLALGLTPFDPYHLGFESPWLLLTVLGLVLAAWKTHRVAAIILLCAMISFNLRLLESANLWDYLIDPLLVLFAWSWAVHRLFRRAMGRKADFPLSAPGGSEPGTSAMAFKKSPVE
jgi:hypothetical protein